MKVVFHLDYSIPISETCLILFIHFMAQKLLYNFPTLMLFQIISRSVAKRPPSILHFLLTNERNTIIIASYTCSTSFNDL